MYERILSLYIRGFVTRPKSTFIHHRPKIMQIPIAAIGKADKRINIYNMELRRLEFFSPVWLFAGAMRAPAVRARCTGEISGLLGVTEETIAAALAQLFQGTRGYYMRTLRSDG